MGHRLIVNHYCSGGPELERYCVSDPNHAIEQELFSLVRRTMAAQAVVGGHELERSSYGILSLLADRGPQRLGSIATTFRLDPSTITRQVQAVVRLGLAEKQTDPVDRRATLLSLTPAGRAAVARDQAHRRRLFAAVMEQWTPEEREELRRSLARLNQTMDSWIERSQDRTGSPAGAAEVNAPRSPATAEHVPDATR